MIYAIIIYIFGYISAYYMGRKNFRKNHVDYTWADVRFLLFFSIISWMSFFIIASDPSTYSFDRNVKCKTKPPKWL